MAKVKGYYNTTNGVFLGPVTARNEETGEAVTPRYIEGVCFGEYDTDTDKFVPHTNPMHIPKGLIYTQDEQIRPDGRLENVRTGMIEDVGADIVSKGFKTFTSNRTPNVITRDEKGNEYPDRSTAPAVKPTPPKTSKDGKIKEAVTAKFFLAPELDSLDLDNLF